MKRQAQQAFFAAGFDKARNYGEIEKRRCQYVTALDDVDAAALLYHEQPAGAIGRLLNIEWAGKPGGYLYQLELQGRRRRRRGRTGCPAAAAEDHKRKGKNRRERPGSPKLVGSKNLIEHATLPSWFVHCNCLRGRAVS